MVLGQNLLIMMKVSLHLFVQGRNGNADSWYGKTVYHDMNDMYDYALKAGYQTVFIQLYDAAGKGSASQWDNGKLLAQN